MVWAVGLSAHDVRVNRLWLLVCNCWAWPMVTSSFLGFDWAVTLVQWDGKRDDLCRSCLVKALISLVIHVPLDVAGACSCHSLKNVPWCSDNSIQKNARDSLQNSRCPLTAAVPPLPCPQVPQNSHTSLPNLVHIPYIYMV